MKTLLWVLIGLTVSASALWIFLATKIIRTGLQLEIGLISPCAVLATLWVVFFIRRRRESKRMPAWFALLFTSISAIAAVWAVALNNRSNGLIWAMNYTNHLSTAVAMTGSMVGWTTSLVWLPRSRNLSAMLTMLTAFWLYFALSLTY